MTSKQPKPNGTQTERDARGRFVVGNSGGPGNPWAAEMAKRRARLGKILRDEDIDRAFDVIRDVMANGRPGDRLQAVRLLLERALGPATAVDLEERLVELEGVLNELRERIADAEQD